MAQVVIRDLRREFASGGGLRGVSLTIESGEFFVVLGPSGCGKSTLLRLVAGLETADSGTVEIGGVAAGAGVRNGAVAMVFQNYALYPHMTARDNIAFPLRLMGVKRDEIARRVEASAKAAGLATGLDRRPEQLSGGERQRVALARALVREPRVILMDEPLSNLDAKLRATLRAELRRFQRVTARTVIYVTHDQLEALTLADRVAVLRSGRLEQVGPPAELYGRPANQFVASFVGQPPMNLIRASVSPDGAALTTGETRLDLAPPRGAGAEVTIGVRPEILDTRPAPGKIEFEIEIERVEFSGARYLVAGSLGESKIAIEMGERRTAGERLKLYADRAALHFFDPLSGRRIS
jgi:ABC-type sugar transport system ATPase subunit